MDFEISKPKRDVCYLQISERFSHLNVSDTREPKTSLTSIFVYVCLLVTLADVFCALFTGNERSNLNET